MPSAMTHTTFILDLTRTTSGADATIASCRDLQESNWDVLVLWADAAGAEAARALSSRDTRLTSICAGSGAGVCDWRSVVHRASGSHVVFLTPGDCVRSGALASWRRGLNERDDAKWVLAASAGAPCNGWWFQRDLADSAAALLVIGAAFPECAAMVRRDVWLDAAARFPETITDSSRASAWLAIACLDSPALVPEVVSTTPGAPSQVDADTIVRVLEGLARRDPAAAARLVADVGRLAAGLRIAQDGLLDALRATDTCFRPATPPSLGPDEMVSARQFFVALLGRGERPVWIWGAGSLGLTALAWCRSHAIPVAGFLDSDPRRNGTEWGGLTVQCGASLLQHDLPASPLVMIASMHHRAIAAGLVTQHRREGRDFVVFPAASSDGAAA